MRPQWSTAVPCAGFLPSPLTSPLPSQYFLGPFSKQAVPTQTFVSVSASRVTQPETVTCVVSASWDRPPAGRDDILCLMKAKLVFSSCPFLQSSSCPSGPSFQPGGASLEPTSEHSAGCQFPPQCPTRLCVLGGGLGPAQAWHPRGAQNWLLE